MKGTSTDIVRGVLTAVLVTTLVVGPGAAAARADDSLEDRVRQLEDLVRRQGEMLEKQQQHIEAQNQRLERQQEQIQMQTEAAHAKGAPMGAVVPTGDAADAAAAANAAAAAATAAAAAANAAAEDDDRVRVSTGYGGVKFDSADGRFQFVFGGRIQLDGAWFDDDITPFGSGAEIRRARFVANGTAWDVWKYKLELNFSSDVEAEITDGWLSYNGFKPVSIIVGHQKVPWGQQSASSSNWQVFQERGMIDSFIDTGETGRRRLGIAAIGYGEHWLAHAGFFGEGIDDDSQFNSDWGTAARVVGRAFAEKRKVAAVGGSIYYRNFNGGNDLRFRARPESHIGSTRLIDTGDIIGEKALLMYNAEATGVLGSAHAQFEYVGSHVDRGGLPNPNFGGFYVQAGYFLTGESRNYDKKSGKYKRIIPNGIVGDGGIGAWEIAARYSTLDLQSEDIPGGKQWNVTAGVNWWATPSIAFRLNYVYANVNPNSSVTLGGDDEQVNVLMGRAQIVF
ncbi:MAG TPA: porin [Gammaproteobacteria bacterium]